MTRTLTARFDGHALIPNGPVDLPTETELTVTVETPPEFIPALSDPSKTIEEKLAALEELFAMAMPGGNIPDEALRRENLYGDDGR